MQTRHKQLSLAYAATAITGFVYHATSAHIAGPFPNVWMGLHLVAVAACLYFTARHLLLPSGITLPLPSAMPSSATRPRSSLPSFSSPYSSQVWLFFRSTLHTHRSACGIIVWVSSLLFPSSSIIVATYCVSYAEGRRADAGTKSSSDSINCKRNGSVSTRLGDSSSRPSA